MPRLFLALDLPPAARERLAAVGAAARAAGTLPKARWTPRERLHLTLRFLGDVEDEAVPTLVAQLGEAEGPALQLRIRGLGVFPHPRCARVLFARVEPDANLVAVQAQVEAAAQQIGLPPKPEPFRPHITLARFRRRPPPRQVRALLDAHAALALDAEVAAFHLVESVLRPEGAVHTRRASFPLSA